jgi:hypothetical protein
MNMVLTDSGAELILRKYFKNVGATANNDVSLKLFTNNINPSDTDIAATYTEAAGGGYAAKTLTAANFTISTVAGISQAAYALQTYTFTGALTASASVYGWYLVDGDGVLICAQKSDTVITPANGSQVLVTPTYQLSKGTPS